jgi:AcrR family transcriptional regulator
MTTSELTRRERKKDEMRRRICDAAIRLFREKGFEQTTIDEISEHADVGRGTFFNYFPRKESVLAWYCERQFLPSEERARALLADPRPARDRLADLYCEAAASFEADAELARYVIREILVRRFSGTNDQRDASDELVFGIVRQGTERGELRPGVEPRRVEGLLTSVFIGTLLGWLLDDREGCCGEFELQPELRVRLALAFDGVAVAGRTA